MNACAHVNEPFHAPVQQSEAARFGLWIFLATEILFFGVLFAAYVICRLRFPDAFAQGSRHTDFVFGTIETALLLSSSALAALAVRDIELGGRRVATRLLMLTGACGIAFLVLHGIEYRDEYREGLVPALRYTQEGPLARPMELFFCLYYVITGFHGLHVAIGVGVLGVLAWRTAHARFDGGYYTPVELGALYWHLVDIVWIFVYPLIYLVGRAQ